MNKQPNGAFAVIFEASAIGITVCDHTGSIVQANPAFSEMLGYRPGELAGKSYAEITHPDDLPIELDLLEDLAAGKYRHYQLRKRYLCRDGTSIWVQIMASILPNAGKEPRLISVVESLNHCLLASARALSASGTVLPPESCLRWSCDLCTGELRWSDHVPALLGYAQGELKPSIRAFLSLVTPEERFRVLRHVVRSIRRGQKEFSLEYQLCSAQGRKLSIFCEGQVLRDAEGRPLRTFGVMVDVTEERQKQEEKEDTAKTAGLQSTLAEIGQHALAGMACDELMTRIVQAAATGLSAEVAVLTLLEGRSFYIRAAAGWPPSVVGTNIGDLDADSFSSYAIGSPEPVFVDDISKDARFRSPALLAFGIVSAMAVGIHMDGKPFGVLMVMERRQRTFASTEASFLKALANTFALSVLRERAQYNRAALLRWFISLQQQERRSLARELHDEAGQSLTGLLVGLRAIINTRRLADAKRTASKLREIAASTLDDLGRLARGLHPSVLDDLGLEVAIRHYAAEYSARYRIEVEVRVSGLPSGDLRNEVQLTIFRIFQEALTNVARHSGARRVEVVLALERPMIQLSIADDGQGFDPQAVGGRRHLGISGMKERAALLEGDLRIESSAGQGTIITVLFPYSLAAAQQSESSGVKNNA